VVRNVGDSIPNGEQSCTVVEAYVEIIHGLFVADVYGLAAWLDLDAADIVPVYIFERYQYVGSAGLLSE
jgi:hypothetical protein